MNKIDKMYYKNKQTELSKTDMLNTDTGVIKYKCKKCSGLNKY